MSDQSAQIPTPHRFTDGRTIFIKLPGPADRNRNIVRTRVTPAEATTLFASVSEDSVSLWTTVMAGDEFRLSFDDGTGAPGDRVIIATSATPWLASDPYIHRNPPFGNDSVWYFLHVFRDGRWSQAGRIFLDLANWRLTAPVLDEVASHYNGPYLHVEWAWDGDRADLSHFVVWVQHPSGEEFEAISTEELSAHLQIDGPHEASVYVAIEAVGTVLAPARSSTVELFDGGAEGGEGDPDQVGDPGLRSNFDHRLVTPNLCRNSSYEQHTGGDPHHWTYTGGAPSPITDAAWLAKHGTHHASIAASEVLEQSVIIRLANSDIFSLSLVAESAGGTIRITTPAGEVIAEQTIIEGLNKLEGFRVPSTDDRFVLKVLGAASWDRVQVNQGATVDPWKLYATDLLYETLEAAGDLIQQQLDAILADFQAVYDLMGGVSGSTILTLEDSINIIVAALEDPGNGTFGRILTMENGISINTAALQTLDGTVNAAQAAITALQAITSGPDGNTALRADLTLITNVINDPGTGLVAAHTSISQHSTLIYGPDGNANLRAAITLLNQSLIDGLALAQAQIDSNTNIIQDPATGNLALSSSLNLANQSIVALQNDLGEAEDDIAAAQSNIGTNTAAITHPQTGNAALSAAINAQASVISEIDGDLNLALSSIALNASNIDGLEAQLVLKVQANGDIAVVRLDASAGTGTLVTIKADNIDIIGVVNFLNAQAAGGNTTIDGGTIHATSTIRIGTATKWLEMAYVGSSLGGFIRSNNDRIGIHPDGGYSHQVAGSNPGVFAYNFCQTEQVNAELLVTVGGSGGYAQLSPTELTFFAPPTAPVTPPSTEWAAEDFETELASHKAAHAAAIASSPHQAKITGAGFEFTHPDGTTKYRVEVPEEITVHIDLSGTANGATYSQVVTITARATALFHATPYQASLHVGDISPVAGPDIPVYSPIVITAKTTTTFTFEVVKHETSTADNVHTVKFWIA